MYIPRRFAAAGRKFGSTWHGRSCPSNRENSSSQASENENIMKIFRFFFLSKYSNA